MQLEVNVAYWAVRLFQLAVPEALREGLSAEMQRAGNEVEVQRKRSIGKKLLEMGDGNDVDSDDEEWAEATAAVRGGATHVSVRKSLGSAEMPSKEHKRSQKSTKVMKKGKKERGQDGGKEKKRRRMSSAL